MDGYTRLIERYETSPFNDYLGLEVLKLDQDGVLLKLNIKENHLNMNGTVHGGVYATMLDVILGMAISSVTKKNGVTISLNINYLAPTFKDSDIYAKATVIQQGYRLVTVEGEIFNENKELLTKGIGTFKLISD